MPRADIIPSNWPQMYEIPLHQKSFTDSIMHMYQGPPPPIDNTSKEYHYTD